MPSQEATNTKKLEGTGEKIEGAGSEKEGIDEKPMPSQEPV